jgi:hypothetical protein
MTLRIVARGIWLYGGTIETPVDIVSLDYDWGYEFDRADGRLEPGQVPEQMGGDGVLYYGRFKFALDPTEPTRPDTPGYKTIDEAMRHAERSVACGIRWSAQQPA